MNALPPGTRILIVADNASVRFGGEAILPLHHFTRLARRGLDVRLLTHERNRAELARTLPDLAERIRYTPDTVLHRLLWRLAAPLPGVIRDHLFGNLMGLLTMHQQRRAIRAMQRDWPVDLIHQPTPVSPAAPSALHGFGVPVIIGPMNGGMQFPPGYTEMEGRGGQLFMRLGRAGAGLVNRLIPGKSRAALLLVANARTRAALPVRHPWIVDLPENAVELPLWPVAPASDRAGLRLAFMGRLVALKGLDHALHAMALAIAARPDLPVSLDVLGDGPERAALESLTDRLGLRAVVRFDGFLPQAECAARLRDLDALILPSLRECGGAVVLEAMAMGRPVIAADWGGPADYLDENCGYLVHPAPRASFSQRLGQAIVALAEDPHRRAAMGAAGAAKVRALYDWEDRVDRMCALYAQTLKRKPPSS